MVQLKYFGDSRDYFKYDLIRTVFERLSLRHYVFIPMLTEHREDKEGRKPPANRGDKSQELLAFIKGCGSKSLAHWERWLAPYVQSYSTITPVDRTFFSDTGRDAYWQQFRPLIQKENALVFVDPDTGLQTGGPRYLEEMGREKYILNAELQLLMEVIDPSSVLMVYQHLQNDKRKHVHDVEKKLAQVRGVNAAPVLACAYREDDLAFLFASRRQSLHDETFRILGHYHACSTHPLKSLHG